MGRGFPLEVTVAVASGDKRRPLIRHFRAESKKLERYSEDTIQNFNLAKSEHLETQRRELTERLQRTDARIRELSRHCTSLEKLSRSAADLLDSYSTLNDQVRSSIQSAMGAAR